METDTVVAGGVVRGQFEDRLAVFRGIPYASLERRLWAPEAVRPWSGTRDAMRFGPAPPQAAMAGSGAHEVAEADWLTVNVWSPEVPGSLPVMVWI